MEVNVLRKKGILFWLKKNYVGFLFIMPVMLGILFFTVIPMFSSLYYSFFDYDVFTPPTNFGFQNYIKPFTTGSKEFVQSLKVTFLFSIIQVPLTIVLSFSLAMFLNQNIKGAKVYRLLYYLPCIIPAVVGGFLWRDIMNVDYGIFNGILSKLGIPKYPFFTKAETSMPSLIFTTLFGLGGGMLLWLAAFKNVSATLYESAKIEGAGWWTRLFKITIPMCAATIFYNFITGVIGALQTFGGVFVMTGGGGGKENSLLFYVMNIYTSAFGGRSQMGYASALSWILFAIIGILSIIIFKFGGGGVYYEDDN